MRVYLCHRCNRSTARQSTVYAEPAWRRRRTPVRFAFMFSVVSLAASIFGCSAGSGIAGRAQSSKPPATVRSLPEALYATEPFIEEWANPISDRKEKRGGETSSVTFEFHPRGATVGQVCFTTWPGHGTQCTIKIYFATNLGLKAALQSFGVDAKGSVRKEVEPEYGVFEDLSAPIVTSISGQKRSWSPLFYVASQKADEPSKFHLEINRGYASPTVIGK